MKEIILLIFLFIFKSTISANLFFEWRITDSEKDQIKEESLSLFNSNIDLYKKFISNYRERNNIYKNKNKSPNSDSTTEEEEPVLLLSRYTHCQKCLTFVKSIRKIKEKYGIQNVYDNLKDLCPWIKSSIAIDACEGYIDNYGAILIENLFSKYIEDYFLCEKIDLCPTQKPKNYINPDNYADRVLKGKQQKVKGNIKESGKKLKVLQITDLHLDIEYQEGANGECSYPICCRNSTNDKTIRDPTKLCGKYGYEGKADISESLFDSFLDDASKREIDFIIWTGDNAPHDGWLGDQTIPYDISERLRDKLNQKFRNGTKNIPIFYCLGNHEKYPFDTFYDDEKDILKKYGEIYEGYLKDDKNALNNFTNYGYYSKKYLNSNLRIIALNCLLCDSFNFNLFNSTKKGTKDMINWLEEQLQFAENNNEFVFIINHFPLNGEFTLTECAKRFQALFDRYEYIIRGIFSGHTHRDDIEGISEYFNKDKIIHLNFVAPQLTTYDYKLPSYRIYTIDDETKQVLDYEQFRFNLTKSNEAGSPYWFSAYNASDFYNVANLSEYNKIINFEKMDDYVYNQYSGSKIGETYKNNTDMIKAAKCIMTTNNFDEYFECYNPKIDLRYEFLMVLTNFLIGPFEE